MAETFKYAYEFFKSDTQQEKEKKNKLMAFSSIMNR